MTNRSEGGKWALAGYLYQLIGQHSLTLRVIGSQDGPLEVDDEVNISLMLSEFDSDSASLAEMLGQDAAMISEKKVVLVQFMYSTRDRRIDRTEIDEIITNLLNDAKEASKQTQGTVACMLVTNRELTGPAKEHWADAARDKKAGFDLFLKHQSMEEGIRHIDEFGMTYGATRDERAKAVDLLLGSAFRVLGEGKTGTLLTKEDFVEAFTGSRDGCPLTVSVIASIARESLKQYGEANHQTDKWKGTGVRREALDDLLQAIYEHALVIVTGMGGCGKSMLVWNLLYEISQQEAGGCAIDFAQFVESNWIAAMVNKWRNLPSDTLVNNNPDLAVERLLIANPQLSKPVIYLGLDGIDEYTDLYAHKGDLRESIELFVKREQDCRKGDPPDATLIVSCRDKDEVLREWLPFPPGGSGIRLRSIRVSEFSNDEFMEAMKLAVPDLYLDLVEAQPPQSARREPGTYEYGVDLQESIWLPAGTEQIDARVHKMLLHPVMWRGLLALDQAERMNAIRGKPDAIDAMVTEFLRWFHYKVRRRRIGLSDLSFDTFAQLLSTIAKKSNYEGANGRDGEWVGSACSTHQVNEREALALYLEACSIGLITENPRMKWWWRNPFVAETLARAKGGSS